MDQNSKLQSQTHEINNPSHFDPTREFSNLKLTDNSKINTHDQNPIEIDITSTQNPLSPKYSLKNQFFSNENSNQNPITADIQTAELDLSDPCTDSEESDCNLQIKDEKQKIENNVSIPSAEKSNSTSNISYQGTILMDFFEQTNGKFKLNFSKIFELLQEWMDMLLEQENLLKFKADHISNWMNHFDVLKSSMSEINEKIDNYKNKLEIFDDILNAIDEKYPTYSKLLKTADKILSNNIDAESNNQNNEKRMQLYSSTNEFETHMKNFLYKFNQTHIQLNNFNNGGFETYLEMTESLANFEIITSLVHELIRNIEEFIG